MHGMKRAEEASREGGGECRHRNLANVKEITAMARINVII